MAARRIAVLAPEAGGFYVGDLLAGVDEACAARDVQVVVVQTAVSWQAAMFDHPSMVDFVRIARAQRDGVIAFTATSNADEIALLASLADPMVTVAGPPRRPGGAAVVVDNAGGAAQAISHLIGHGHRRIGFVGAFVQHDVADRYAGYVAALREAGIEPDPALRYAVQSDLTDGGAIAAKAILDAGVPLTAVFASTDAHAVSLMAALQAAGYRVPDDIAIIGFDDSELAQTAVPALTSVRQLPKGLGLEASMALFGLIGGDRSADRLHIMPTALIQRHSCGCFDRQRGFSESFDDWNAPEWQDHLRTALEELLVSTPELPGELPGEIWPGVDVVIKSFDAAVRGQPPANIAELDEAWRAAIHRTRNAETLLGLVDLLEFVGLCRQVGSGDDPDLIRPRLRGFLAEARLQVLRSSSIVDPLRHPQAPRMVRDLTRSFLDPGPRGAANLDWLSHIDATLGCLALWEPAESGSGRRLRIAGLYGAAVGTLEPGDIVEPENFPPLEWSTPAPAGHDLGTITILPISTPDHEWGILAAILPKERRYFDGFWALHYGASIVTLAVERAAAAAG